MARTVIAPVLFSQFAFQVWAFAAGDVGNGNYFISTNSKQALLVKNNHGSLAKKVTLYDAKSAKVEYSIPFGTTVGIGPLPASTYGLASDGNKIYVDPETTDIQFAVITLP